MLCASTSTTNREPFSTWSETQSQVRTVKRHPSELRQFRETTVKFNFFFLFSGFTVNGQIIGKNIVVPDGPHKALTYFGRLGISHQKLGMRMEVSTQDISIFHNGKKVKFLWSNAASMKDSEWVSLLYKHYY